MHALLCWVGLRAAPWYGRFRTRMKVGFLVVGGEQAGVLLWQVQAVQDLPHAWEGGCTAGGRGGWATMRAGSGQNYVEQTDGRLRQAGRFNEPTRWAIFALLRPARADR